jgi:DNA polymerase III delta prime subunit
MAKLLEGENDTEFKSQLNAKPRHFFNRARLHEQITTKLDKKRSLILYGKPGTGKSSLARHYAECFMAEGGVVREIKCEFTNRILENMFNLLAASKRYEGSISTIDKATLLVEIAKLLNELNGRVGVLFIFDNVEFYDRIADYFDMLPAHVRVIVTTRSEKMTENFSEQSADCMRVSDFSRDEFVAYMEQTFATKISEPQSPPLTTDQLDKLHHIVRIGPGDGNVRPCNANKLVVLILGNINALHIEDFIKLTQCNWSKLFVK